MFEYFQLNFEKQKIQIDDNYKEKLRQQDIDQQDNIDDRINDFNAVLS